MEETCLTEMAPTVRQTFCYILGWCDIIDAGKLFNQFKEHLIADFLHRFPDNEAKATCLSLMEIDRILNDLGRPRKYKDFNLPKINE